MSRAGFRSAALTLLVLALFALAAGCSRSRASQMKLPRTTHPEQMQPNTPGSCRLAGVVTREGQRPVEGAVVSLNRVRTGLEDAALERPIVVTTDRDGRWSATLPRASRYALLVTSAREVARAQESECCEGCANRAPEIVLKSGGIPVSGAVALAAEQRAAGALLLARQLPVGSSGWNQGGYAAFSDEQGRFAFSLEEGEYLFEIAYPGYATEVISPVQVHGSGAHRDVLLLPAGAVSGTVVQRDSRTPVPNAIVRAHVSSSSGALALNLASTTADAAGRFTMRGLRPGDVELVAAAPKLASAVPVSVSIPFGGERTEANVELVAAYDIAGVVSARDDESRALSGLRVDAREVDTGLSSAAALASDADGRFVVSGLVPGRYTLDVYGAGRVPFRTGRIVEVTDRDVLDEKLVIDRGFVVSGRVEPALAAELEVSRARDGADALAASQPKLHLQTSANGSFELSGVRPGEVVFAATARDGKSGVLRAHVADRDLKELVIRLEPRASIAGRVLDDRGEVVFDAWVEVSSAGPSYDLIRAIRSKVPNDSPAVTRPVYRSEEGRNVYRLIQPDAAGNFEARGLPPGDYELHVFDPQGARDVMSQSDRSKVASEAGRLDVPDLLLMTRGTRVHLDGTERKQIQLSVPACRGSIHGTVKDRTGARIENAWVFARRQDWQRKSTIPVEVPTPHVARTRANGSFELGQICNGSYELEAIAESGKARGKKLDVVRGAPTMIRIEELGTFSGVVTLGGRPLHDYVVSLTGPAERHQSVHSSDGRFRLTGLEASEYGLLIEAKDGYIATTVAVVGDRPRTMPFELSPYATVSGTVVNEADAPLAGVEVRLMMSDVIQSLGRESPALRKLRTQRVFTDARGQFVFSRALARTGQVSLRSGRLPLLVETGKFMAPIGPVVGPNYWIDVNLNGKQSLDMGTIRTRGNIARLSMLGQR